MEMVEGERLVYDVELSTANILRIRVDQEDLDAVLSIESPTGLRREFDSGNAFNGPEWLIYQSQDAGIHRVEVEIAAAKNPGEGRISLTVEALGEARPEDLILLAAYDALGSISARATTPEEVAGLKDLMDRPSDALPGLVRARVSYLIGRVHRFAGQPQEAATFLRRAKDGFRSYGNAWEETFALNHLGFVLIQIGELEEAEGVLTRAEELGHRIDQPRALAATWSNLGILNAVRGRHSEALRQYRRSEELFGQIEAEVGLAYCRNNIGVQLLFLGEVGAGLRSLREAAELWRTLDRPLDLATTYISLAWGFSLRSEMTDQLTDLETALDFSEEAVAIFEAQNSRWDLGVALEQRGRYQLELENPKLALQDLNRAADLAGRSNDRMNSSWLGLGRGAAHARLGRPEEARVQLEQSLQGFVELGHHTGQIEAYLELARLERSAEDRDRAADLLVQAIEVVENPRRQLQTDQFRRSYLAIHQDVYQELIDLWAEASWKETFSESADPSRARRLAERALEASERGRAQGLLDWFTRSDRRWIAASPMEELRRTLDSLEARALFPSDASDESLPLREGATPTAADIAAVERARLEWWQALETDRSTQSSVASVSQAPKIESIYQQLDEGTTIVAYSLGRQQSWAFLVTTESTHVVPLAPRNEIEAAARRAQELLPRWDFPGSRLAARESLSVLSELVWSPFVDLLVADQIGIVAAGALLGVPFAVINDSNGRPLAASRSFVYLPSLSTLEHLRSRRSSSPPAMSESQLTIIADPVFGRDDPRLSPRASGPTDQRRGILPRLPGTSLEAGHLEELLAGLSDGPQVRVFEGFEAKAVLFRDGTLRDSRFLHIATHGIVDDHDPALAGLVLSLFDSQGQSLNGFLPVRDLYQFQLTADLVVLSACRTGKGQPIRGEGLVGFSHAFFAAGAQHLLVSLWDVDDEATAELMKRYYSYLFAHRLEPVHALRMTQEEMRRHPRWSSPRHWAGFVAWGDWKLGS